ncbi:MAG: hypothetical protein GVY29_03375 [Spirochaetes bacterium]|nr:hypothetical protein [Spirochaetota bacterium]
MKRALRKGAIFLAALAAVVLVFSGCATIRTSSHAYDTGDVLDPGQMRFTTDSVMFLWVPLPGQIAVSRGFKGGWEATAGWGMHGFVGNEEDVEGASEDDDTLHGPELYVSKRLLSVKEWLQVSGTVGTDINVAPQVDALVQGRLTVGWHPADWFTIYANGGAAYVTASSQFAPIVGLGLGLDGRFVLKAAAYVTPDQTESQKQLDVLWPFYYGVQLGFKTKGAGE